jgi:hypothetical protein
MGLISTLPSLTKVLTGFRILLNLLFGVKKWNNRSAGLTDFSGTAMVLIFALKRCLIRDMFSSPRISISSLVINNSRFLNLFHRFGKVISTLIINGGRVKFLRLTFL